MAITVEKQLTAMLSDLSRLFAANIQYENCPHGGAYHAFLRVCDSCTHRVACSWLNESDPKHQARRKAVKQLAHELQVAHDTVYAEIGHSHKINTCRCEYCTWLRASDRLLHDSAVVNKH